MKKLLLSFAFLFAGFMVYGQCGNNGCGETCGNDRSVHSNSSYSTTTVAAQPKLSYKVYPNPTINTIQIDDETAQSSSVQSFHIFNMLGQEVKSFAVVKGQTYSVADLQPGNYLLQFRDYKDKVMMTRKLIKAAGDQLN